MPIGINWDEIWAADVWGPVWQQEVQAPTDTTDGFGGPKREEEVYEPGVKPRKKASKQVQPILTPKAPKREEQPEHEKPTRKRRARKEPELEVPELRIAPQFGAESEISIAPVLECGVALTLECDPRFSIVPTLESLDDAVAIAIGHPELALQIGDFLPVQQFDKPGIMGYDLV